MKSSQTMQSIEELKKQYGKVEPWCNGEYIILSDKAYRTYSVIRSDNGGIVIPEITGFRLASMSPCGRFLRVIDRETGKCGIWDECGREILPCVYPRIQDDFADDGLSRTIDPWGLIGIDGKYVIEPGVYHHISPIYQDTTRDDVLFVIVQDCENGSEKKVFIEKGTHRILGESTKNMPIRRREPVMTYGDDLVSELHCCPLKTHKIL